MDISFLQLTSHISMRYIYQVNQHHHPRAPLAPQQQCTMLCSETSETSEVQPQLSNANRIQMKCLLHIQHPPTFIAAT